MEAWWFLITGFPMITWLTLSTLSALFIYWLIRTRQSHLRLSYSILNLCKVYYTFLKRCHNRQILHLRHFLTQNNFPLRYNPIKILRLQSASLGISLTLTRLQYSFCWIRTGVKNSSPPRICQKCLPERLCTHQIKAIFPKHFKAKTKQLLLRKKSSAPDSTDGTWFPVDLKAGN